MNRRSLLALLSSGAGRVPLRAAGDEPPLTPPQIREMLERVAAVYAEAARHVSMMVETQYHDGIGPTPQRDQYFDHSGDLWRTEHRPHYPAIYIIGAERSWMYRVFQREYIDRPNTDPLALSWRKSAENQNCEIVQRFTLLLRMDVPIEFRGWDTVKNKSGRFRCASISIRPGGGLNWTEQLWIDPRTALIWKCVRDTPLKTYHHLWHRIVIHPPPDPALFVFQPPKNAIRRERFTVYRDGH